MTPDRVLVEACVTSVEEATRCVAAGARRVELCRALEVDGLTPALATVRAVLRQLGVPTFVLVRSSPGSFRLTPGELSALVADVAALAETGVAGVVVGALDRSGRVDVAGMSELVAAAAGKPVTFHRAFDQVREPLDEVEALLRAGVGRVLTSGGAATAWEGRHVLRALVDRAGGDLTILGGGAVRGDHVRALIEFTGLREVHARASAIPEVLAALSSNQKLPSGFE